MPREAPSSRNRGNIAAGDIFAVPLAGWGYCHAVVARAPACDADVDFALLYVRPQPGSKASPAPGIDSPGKWGTVWLGLVSPDAMRKGRWPRCGRVKGFDPGDWPVPPWRASAVDEQEPMERWGIEPWGEMWSIEVTSDEPTMTLIDNTPASRQEALAFPSMGVVNAASRLEKSLVRLFGNMGFTFHDMPIATQRIDASAIKRWAAYAARVRARHASFKPTWLPAGKKTDRALSGGAWLAFPLCGGGFGAAMLIEKLPKHLRFFGDVIVMAMRRQWKHWPTLEQLLPLTARDGAYVTQTSMICVRDGRWRVMGYDPYFDASQWPWPVPWTIDRASKARGQIVTHNHRGESVSVNVNPSVLRLDLQAGHRCSGMSVYHAIEQAVPTVMNGTHWSLQAKPNHAEGIVTPNRIDAWQAINAAIAQSLATSKPKRVTGPILWI